MTSNQESSRKSKNTFTKVFDDIRITPMKVWLAIQDGSDISVLVQGKSTEAKIKEAWDKLYDSYITEFGITDEYKNFLFKQRNLAYAMLDDIEESTPFTKQVLKKLQREVDDYFKDKPKEKTGLMYAQVERFMYRELNPETTTVYQYYNYHRLMVQTKETERE